MHDRELSTTHAFIHVNFSSAKGPYLVMHLVVAFQSMLSIGIRSALQQQRQVLKNTVVVLHFEYSQQAALACKLAFQAK